MSACVLWKGGTNGHGYGRHGSTINGRRQPLAHVIAWERENGPVPAGMQIHHTCGVRLCVNTAHLIALTIAQHNAAHAQSSRRIRCAHGHLLTEGNRVPNGKSPAGAQKWTCRTCKRDRRAAR